jgi:hypothetical protein
METTVREEVQKFTRACEALSGFAHEHNGLTALERETVVNFVRALEQEVAPPPPEPPQDDPPLAATLSHVPLID